MRGRVKVRVRVRVEGVRSPAQLAVQLPVVDLAAAVRVDLVEERVRLLTRHVPDPEQGEPLAEFLLGDGARAVGVPLMEDLPVGP